MTEEEKNLCKRPKTTSELFFGWLAKNKLIAMLFAIILAFYIGMKAIADNEPLNNIILSIFK